jgi:hypothetical protein
MAITCRVVVRSETPGGFHPDTFDHLLHAHILLPGLDPAFDHTLLDVAVDDRGDSAELLIGSEHRTAVQLQDGLRVVSMTPTARVRVFADDGRTVLAETRLPAPLQAGQEVALGDDHYHVDHVEWPHRLRSGALRRGDVDWQHVIVKAAPRPAAVPVPAAS